MKIGYLGILRWNQGLQVYPSVNKFGEWECLVYFHGHHEETISFCKLTTLVNYVDRLYNNKGAEILFKVKEAI